MSKILIKTLIYRIITIFFDTLVLLAFKIPIKQALGSAFFIEIGLHSLIYYFFEKRWETKHLENKN
jgi:hypothetical protein